MGVKCDYAVVLRFIGGCALVEYVSSISLICLLYVLVVSLVSELAYFI